MNDIDKIAALLSTFSSIAVSLGAVITLLATVFKPVRKAIVFIFNKLWDRKDKNQEIINKIDKVESTLSKKVDGVREELTKKIQEVSDRNDENEKDRIRWEVLDFSNSCKNGRRHAQDEYRHIIELNAKYHRLLDKSGDQNGVFDTEYEFVKREYARCLEENDFL